MSVPKCTYMQQHANPAIRTTATRTAKVAAPPNADASTSSTAAEPMKVGDISDDDEPPSEKCSECVRNNCVDADADDADAGVGSTSGILPLLEISSGDMAIFVEVMIIVRRSGVVKKI